MTRSGVDIESNVALPRVPAYVEPFYTRFCSTVCSTFCQLFTLSPPDVTGLGKSPETRAFERKAFAKIVYNNVSCSKCKSCCFGSKFLNSPSWHIVVHEELSLISALSSLRMKNISTGSHTATPTLRVTIRRFFHNKNRTI